jgi:altronate dehydratase large subunit
MTREAMMSDSGNSGLYFDGYVRRDGRVGIRNHVLVLGINGLIAPAIGRIAAGVKDAIAIASPYGRGQFGGDKTLHEAQMIGLAANPNVAAALIVSADRMTAEMVAEAAGRCGKPVEIAALDDFHEDVLALIDHGVRTAARLARRVSAQRRERVPLSKLFVAVECGHSDSTSGIVANPLVGRLVDRVVHAGGTGVVGETIEWLGAEHIVSRRAVDERVGNAIVDAVIRRERAVAATGMDLTGNNPGVENIRGGLTSIEEKSLGAMAKSGSNTIQGLLAMTEAPAQSGLYLMDTPSFSPESLTSFVAAGAQLVLFTTGAGNSYCSQIAPTIKISARPNTARILVEQIDFDASAVIDQGTPLDALADDLLAHVCDVCSGTLTWGEVLHQGAESIVRIGESL